MLQLSYEYRRFENPQVDERAGIQLARERCRDWGFQRRAAQGRGPPVHRWHAERLLEVARDPRVPLPADARELVRPLLLQVARFERSPASCRPHPADCSVSPLISQRATSANIARNCFSSSIPEPTQAIMVPAIWSNLSLLPFEHVAAHHAVAARESGDALVLRLHHEVDFARALRRGDHLVAELRELPVGVQELRGGLRGRPRGCCGPTDS